MRITACSDELSETLRGPGLLHHAFTCGPDVCLPWRAKSPRLVRSAGSGTSFTGYHDDSRGWIEVVGGLLVAVGLLTSIAAFICSGEMAVAFFMVHAKTSFIPIVNHGEAAVLYCWVFLFIFLRPRLD